MSRPRPFEITDRPTRCPGDFVAEVPAGLTDAEALLRALAAALRLPDYFGFNWNALEECLRDFHWIEERRIVLHHADLPPLPAADLLTYLEILAASVEDWSADEAHELVVELPASAEREVARALDCA